MDHLEIKKRDNTKNRQLRDQGIIPGVLSGQHFMGIPIQAKKSDLDRAIHTTGEVYKIKSDRRNVMVKFDELQRDPVSHQLTHFSLVELPVGVLTTLEVPIVFQGQPKGLREGGILVTPHDKLTVEGKPKEMPSEIVIDISNMQVGDKLCVSDIATQKNCKICAEENEIVAVMTPPTKAEVNETTTEALPEILSAAEEENNETNKA